MEPLLRAKITNASTTTEERIISAQILTDLQPIVSELMPPPQQEQHSSLVSLVLSPLPTPAPAPPPPPPIPIPLLSSKADDEEEMIPMLPQPITTITPLLHYLFLY